MRGGFIAISRDAWDHYAFKDEPMSMREAWFWMLAQAAWKPTKIRTPHGIVELQRGQFTHSLRHMAKTFGWSVGRVRRVLDGYSNEHMLVLETGTGMDTAQCVLTICNYDKYQGGGTATGTATDTPVDTKPAHDPAQIRTRETNNQSSNEDIQGAYDYFVHAVEGTPIPKPRSLTKDRKAKIAARLDEHGSDGWREACDKLVASDFCCGRNGGWIANLDFLLQPSSFNKVIEGTYDNRAPQGTGPPQGQSELDRALWGEPLPTIEAAANVRQ
jgi:hypothetical protein